MDFDPSVPWRCDQCGWRVWVRGRDDMEANIRAHLEQHENEGAA